MTKGIFMTTLFFGCVFWSACAGGQWFIPSDLSPEGSFTTNCEGPCVDKSGDLFVVNFREDGTVGRIQAGKPAELWATLPAGSIANSIQIDSKGDLLLADFAKHNVLKINPATKKVSVFCHNTRFNQPNDLCMAKGDVLYASDPSWKTSTGQVWKIAADGVASLVAPDMGTTNGITLSPDEKTLYVNESVQRKIWAFPVLPDGNLGTKRLFASFEDFGLDGMKCDREGNLYVTRWGKGTIVVLSPEGQQIREIVLEGKKVSNLAFGGPDGKTVYVTLQDRKCVSSFRNKIAGKGW